MAAAVGEGADCGSSVPFFSLESTFHAQDVCRGLAGGPDSTSRYKIDSRKYFPGFVRKPPVHKILGSETVTDIESCIILGELIFHMGAIRAATQMTVCQAEQCPVPRAVCASER